VLILDDPAASVDPKTEQEIVAALRHATVGRTTFVVANRLSLLKWADQLLVIDRGRLVQTGTHSSLLLVPGPYRAAAELQLVLGPEKQQEPEEALCSTAAMPAGGNTAPESHRKSRDEPQPSRGRQEGQGIESAAARSNGNKA
jgi:ABC-type glutathione transport system ATPase component